jgi:hypothetical protein
LIERVGIERNLSYSETGKMRAGTGGIGEHGIGNCQSALDWDPLFGIQKGPL